MAIRHTTGPSISVVASKDEAHKQLVAHPGFPKDATDVDVWEENGHWVAAWVESGNDNTGWKTAEFPPSGGDDEEESPSPKPESGGGPEDSAPEPSGDSGGGDGPPSDGGEGPPKKPGDSKGSEKHEITELLDLVKQLTQALGIEPIGGPGEEGPGMGEDMAPPPPGPPGAVPPPGGPHGGHGGPPPGAGGPPGHGHGPGGPDEVIQHQRALKPGETPPGSTPVGAPSFASTIPDSHPWKGVMGKKATFEVSSAINEDTSLSPIYDELTRIAYGTGFRVAQLREGRDGKGKRTAEALISAY